MSDIRFDNALNTNTDVDTDHADASATGGYDGSLSASESGAAYDGSVGGDVSYDATLPEVPDVPETPDVVAEATATADATVDEVSAHADGALSAAGGLPELPETPEVPDPSGSVGIDAAFDAWLDAMGELAANVSGSLSALFGL